MSVPFPDLTAPDPDQDIPSRLRYVARLLPDQIATVDESGATNYATLDARSDQLAARLITRFGSAPEPVALLLPRTVLAAIGIFGVLKAGKFYVPLDPILELPAQRAIFQTSAACIILTCTDLVPLAESFASAETQIIALDTLDRDHDSIAPARVLTYRNYASISFTSGSTGEPKGIIWHHGGWLNRARLHFVYDHIAPGDRVAQFFSAAFVPYSSATFGTLLNGGTLYYHSARARALPELFDWLDAQAITIFFPPVNLLHDLLALDQPLKKIPRVRAILLGGQTILARELVRLKELVAPECVLSHRLSMSELSWVTRYVIRADDIKPTTELVPVGYACDGNAIAILDEHGDPIPPGQLGQIVVQSRYLSPGYWNNSELTATKFLPDPTGGDRRILLTGDVGVLRADGCLEYHGRRDYMVKIRGYRVEPEAIESALLAHAEIQECVVTPSQGRDGATRLLAYLAPRALPAPSTSALRDWLAQTLPAYMIPARFVVLPRLPRNSNDKIDRRALPPPGRARPELDVPFVAPRTDLETRLAQIWSELLDLDEVGVHDNFFALGGDSLLAMNLVLQIENVLGRQVPSDYFRNPTIAGLMSAPTASNEISLPIASRANHFYASPNPWQQRLARLCARQVSLGTILRWAIREVSLRLDFFLAVRWLTWWFAQPICSNTLYRSEREKFKRMATSLGSPDAASENAFRIRMLSNAIWMNAGQWQDYLLKPGGFLNVMRNSRHRFWRSFVRAVEQSNERERERIIIFGGMEHLQNVRAQGRGVILVSYHSPAGSIATSILAQYTDIGSILTISPAAANWLIESEDSAHIQTPNAQQIAMATTIAVHGQRILQTGGIVQVYNDIGGHEPGTLAFPIGEHMYDFKTGFAELALATNAVVIPVYAAHEITGRIRMEFLPPLQTRANVDHKHQVRHLIAQYAQFLEHTWRTVPESISWYILQHHFERPEIRVNES
ncbi:MAG: AMP-binding protein [Chloroflexi bacterium]|nr:AMP-binding protein [Chloroflexota bacterium]